MKTLSMFLRASKTEAEEAGIETEGMATSVSKLREEILSLTKVNGGAGVDIMLDENTYKSTYQILKELSLVWEDISDISQANILEKIAGKRNANIAASVINNFSIAEEALATSANSAGSALAENEKYLDSIAGHINKVTIAFEELSQNFIESDLVKTGADMLTGALTGLNEVLKVVNAFPAAIGAIAFALSGVKNMGFITRVNVDLDSSDKLITQVTNSMRIFGKSFKEIANDTRAYGNIFSGLFSHRVTEKDRSALREYRDEISKALSGAITSENGVNSFDVEGFNVALKNSEDRLSTLSVAGKETADSMKDLAIQFGNGKIKANDFETQTNKLVSAQKASKVSTIALTAATTLLNTALSMGIGLLIQGVITLATTAINEMTNAVSNATEKLNEDIKSVKSLEAEYKNLGDEAQKLRSRINELENLSVPTLFEQDELETLKEENNELERNLKLKELELKVAKDQTNTDAKKTADIYFNGDYVSRAMGEVAPWLSFASPFTAGFNNAFAGAGNTKTEFEKATEALIEYRFAFSKLQYWEESYAKGNTTEKVYKEMTESNKAHLQELEYALSTQRNNLELILAQLDPDDPQNTEYIKQIQDFIKQFDLLYVQVNGLDATKFTEVFNKSEFISVTDKLRELAKQNKLTEESFNNVIGINKFKEALEEIGVVDISEVIRAIIKEVTDSGNAAENAAVQISLYADQLAKIKDGIDNASSMRSTIQGVYDTITKGEFLSDDDIQKFRDYPDLFKKFTKTTDGWTISVQTLKDAYAEFGEEARKSIQQARNETEQALVIKRSEYDAISQKNNAGVNSSYDAKQYANRATHLRELDKTIKDGEESLGAYNILLQMFASTLDDASNKAEETSYDIKTLNSEISTGASAFKEMQENGRLSISTFESLTSLGEDYWKTLTIENGAIKFNIEAFKDLTEAKVQDELATAGLALAEAKLQETYEASHSEYNYTITDRTKQLVNDAQQRFDAIRTAKDNLDYTWEQSLEGNETDTTDKDYQKRLDKLKEANKGTIEDEKKFVEDWTALNEEMYKATDPEKYEENLKEISDYIKGLDSLLDTYLDKWDKVHSYDDKNILSRETRLTESRRVNYETYGDPNSTFYNLDTYEKNIAEQAKYEADTLKIQLDRGLISYSRFISEINRIRENARDRDGNYLLDMSFVSDFKDADKQYEDRLENLKKLNDKSIADEEEYIRKWKSLNQKTYEGVDNTKYKSNLTEIVNYEKELLDHKYKEGLISAEEYHKGIVKLWEENKELLGEGTQTEWLEDMWKQRAETEKTYWEQQKDLASKYYDAEIKALQDVQKEEERISKAEELRLNLIKARQKLEEAKSQKNQLVFHDGTFEYMADQDAIMSAEEEVAESLKAIKENELQEQIDLLEQQRDEALLFYGNIIGLLEYYINGTMEIDSSDSSLIEEAMGSESGKYYMRLFNNEITPDEIRESYKAMFTKSSDDTTSSGKTSNSMITKSSDDTTPSDKATNSMMNWAKSLLSLDVTGIFDAATNFVSMAKYIGSAANGSTLAQDIATAATNNVSNKNETEIDNSVHVGDITMHIHGGTSEEMLNQFANKLGSAISTIVPKAVTAH